MKSTVAFCFIATLVFVAAEAILEECKPNRPMARGKTCTETQCCVKFGLFDMFADCRDIPVENEKCGGLAQCPCKEGLSCVECKCQRSNATTTSTENSSVTVPATTLVNE